MCNPYHDTATKKSVLKIKKREPGETARLSLNCNNPQPCKSPAHHNARDKDRPSDQRGRYLSAQDRKPYHHFATFFNLFSGGLPEPALFCFFV